MSSYFKSDEYAQVLSSMSIYFNTTNIPCILINEEGVTIHREGEHRSYCMSLERLVDGGLMCQNAHLKSSQQSVNLGEAYISYCPAGLVYFAVSISSGQLFKGAVIAGPIHMSEPDVYEVNQTMINYDLPESEKSNLLTYYSAIPILSPTRARFHLKLLTILAKDVMEDNKEALDKKKAFYDEQRHISEKIQSLKEENRGKLTQDHAYPIHLEKSLSMAIIKGDEMAAKSILNDLFGYIFYQYRGDNKKITSITMELLVIMSRAAVEGGARYDDVSKVTQEIYHRSIDTEGIEAMCLWLMDGLERIILFVFPMQAENQEQIGFLRKAIIYMNQHLEENISLEEVANYVGLSPTYFSRLFSNDMKMTYIEYLTKIRIEESKKFLVDSRESMSDIAIRLGFSDQSYFSKVFKKVEGMTPGNYRRMYL